MIPPDNSRACAEMKFKIHNNILYNISRNCPIISHEMQNSPLNIPRRILSFVRFTEFHSRNRDPVCKSVFPFEQQHESDRDQNNHLFFAIIDLLP